ncbi:hypothetical protein T459_32618 [Capsicum annuum]|uniref:Uncharacterized protein n=1 Tax=Capsicum annuum TaxID=4072 RepID=A0A2G2Y1A7_CAPAN|nr:hypothetical protein T459_32618 [Capsicum annuum]
MTRKLRSLELAMKNFQGLGGYKSVSYKDPCMFPSVHLPFGFKMPKFEKYDGHGDPVAHFRHFCNQLRGAGGKEELLMAYFGNPFIKVLKMGKMIENGINTGRIGHSIGDYHALKREIEKMIQDKLIMVQTIDRGKSFSHVDVQTNG